LCSVFCWNACDIARVMCDRAEHYQYHISQILAPSTSTFFEVLNFDYFFVIFFFGDCTYILLLLCSVFCWNACGIARQFQLLEFLGVLL